MEKFVRSRGCTCFRVLIAFIVWMSVGAKAAQAVVSISSFSAVPDTIDLGGSSTLSWATVSATSCDINGNAVAVNGSMTE